jgi:pteridine reductase
VPTSANMCAMKDSALSDQAVLVTGAAKRIGAQLARAFHAEGARVAIHYHRSASEARSLSDELNRTRPNSSIVLSADLRDTAALPAIIEGTVRAFGKLSVLINNASTFYPTPLGSITLEQWQDLIGTNLQAPLFLSQAAAPHLRQSSGLIINLIDIHGQRPLPQHPVYSTAKAGLIMLTRSLARELGPQVRVNGIAPGPILWPEGGIDPKLQDEIVSKTILKRSGSPEDIVKAALFFAKDAPYVTGQILAVDGGRSVGW